MEPPSGYIRFCRTEMGLSELRKYKIALITALFLTIVFVTFTIYLSLFMLLMAIFFIGLASLNSYWLFCWKNLPLAVNINHPWFNEDAIGNAEVMIHVSNGWKKIGNGRVHASKDKSQRTLNLHLISNEIELIGTWENIFITSRNKHVTQLINQALIIRDLTNDVQDSFEDAREREEQLTGLLDRKWIDTTPGQNELGFGALFEKMHKNIPPMDSNNDSEE